jgi:hypothetical protein
MLLMVPPRRGFPGWIVGPPDSAPASSSVTTASAYPLWPPKGLKRAVRLAVHHVRIARGLAGRIDQDAIAHELPLVAGDAHLSHGNRAGRHIQQQRRLALGSGERDADRVGREARVGPPEGRDESPVVGDVDEVQRDETGGTR